MTNLAAQHNSRGIREFRGDTELGTAFAEQRVEQTVDQAELYAGSAPARIGTAGHVTVYHKQFR